MRYVIVGCGRMGVGLALGKALSADSFATVLAGACSVRSAL